MRWWRAATSEQGIPEHIWDRLAVWIRHGPCTTRNKRERRRGMSEVADKKDGDRQKCRKCRKSAAQRARKMFNSAELLEERSK